MKKFNFLICYDIGDSKRLRKVAKYLESEAIRIQKSIFFAQHFSSDEVKILVSTLDSIINQDEDDIRVYKVDKNKSIHLQNGVDLKQPNLIEG